MSNGFYFTPVELACFMADSVQDDAGNVVYGDKAKIVVNHAIERAQRGAKREKKKLTGKNLDKYIAIAKRLIDEAQKEFDNGGKLMSKRAFAEGLELDESTVRRNETLDSIYERFKASNCNARPSTVNNNPDSFFDDDL